MFVECAYLFPNNKPPVIYNVNYRQLCYEDFAILYDRKNRIAIFSIEKLNKKNLIKADSVPRNDKFHEEQSIPKSERTFLSEYSELNKGDVKYDRGHLAPDSNRTSYTASYQAFSLTNMIPQLSSINRGNWKKIEQDIRKYAMNKEHNIYVLTGVNYKSGMSFTIPDSMYKQIYDEKIDKCWGYLLENKVYSKINVFYDCQNVNKYQNFFNLK